jgi:hypothetical protein
MFIATADQNSIRFVAVLRCLGPGAVIVRNVHWAILDCLEDVRDRFREKLRGSRPLPANSGSCAQMQLRGYHLGAAAALEGRKYSDAAAAGVADRHDIVFNRDTAFALALLA